MDNSDVYRLYHDAQNKVKTSQENIAFQRMLSAIVVPEAKAVIKRKDTEGTKKKNKSFDATLSPVGNIRKYENVIIESEDGEPRKQKFLQNLADLTKYRDQWMKQPSDQMTDEQREQLNIKLTKSQKTRMRQNAKMFCTTNKAVDELQRGSLVFTLMMIIENFNPFNGKLSECGVLEQSSAFVLMNQIIPRDLLEAVFLHLFSTENELRKNASPTSKKKIPGKQELFLGKEYYNIFAIVNKWLASHLAPNVDSVTSTSELFLEQCVRVLKENRTNIVCMFKNLEDRQSKNEATNTFKKMIDGVQEDTERTSQKVSSRTKKLEENIMYISNLSEAYKRSQRLLKRKTLPRNVVVEKKTKLEDPRKTKLSKNPNNHLILPASNNVVKSEVLLPKKELKWHREEDEEKKVEVYGNVTSSEQSDSTNSDTDSEEED